MQKADRTIVACKVVGIEVPFSVWNVAVAFFGLGCAVAILESDSTVGVLESKSRVNTFQTAQHNRVLANDPIASVILGKTWRGFYLFIFLYSACLHPIVGRH